VLRNLPGFERTSLLVLHHHENFDGTGYPAQLRGAEIPIGARIVSVIDAFDAMVSSRPYRDGLPVEEAIRRLQESSGTQFDSAIVQSFVRIAQSELAAVLEAVGSSVPVIG
jgi:HD-GYP domain-containing protein (c-di-GMP phosphodiesterase class II)